MGQILHRIIWHASSRGLPSSNLEVERTTGMLQESRRKLTPCKRLQLDVENAPSVGHFANGFPPGFSTVPTWSLRGKPGLGSINLLYGYSNEETDK